MEDPDSTNSLELKLLCCKDLKSFNFFQKLTVYALVSLESQSPHPQSEDQRTPHQQQRTPTDKEGGGDPEWNHRIRFDLSRISSSSTPSSSAGGGGEEDEEKLLFLRFNLRHEGAVFGDKTIGEVRVPLRDLMEESNGVVRFLSYQVRSPDGKPNGVINFSCKFHGPNNQIHHPPPPPIKEEEEGRVQYPTLDLQEDLQSPPHILNIPPPQGFYPPPPPCIAGAQAGYYYQYPYPVRAPGGRVEVQEPWTSPDPFRYGGGGGRGFDYYNNYCSGGPGTPPWSPGFRRNH